MNLVNLLNSVALLDMATYRGDDILVFTLTVRKATIT